MLSSLVHLDTVNHIIGARNGPALDPAPMPDPEDQPQPVFEPLVVAQPDFGDHDPQLPDLDFDRDDAAFPLEPLPLVAPFLPLALDLPVPEQAALAHDVPM